MAKPSDKLETIPCPDRRVTLGVSSVFQLSVPGFRIRDGQRRPLQESPNVLSAGRDLLNRLQRPIQAALNGDTILISEVPPGTFGIE